MDRLNQDGSLLDSLIEETVSYSEEFLGIFTYYVLYFNVKVFEVLRSLGVLLAADIQNMSFICSS